MGSGAFLQEIFLTQGLNPGLLHWRQIHYLLNHQHVCAKLLWLCPNLCDPMDCSPSDCSVCGILQARILGWGAISSSKGSSWPRDQTLVFYVSCVGKLVLPVVLLGKTCYYSKCFKLLPINVIDEWFRPVLWCWNGKTDTLWIYTERLSKRFTNSEI